MALALRSEFGQADSGEDNLSGALMAADFIDDIRQIRQLLESALGVKPIHRKK